MADHDIICLDSSDDDVTVPSGSGQPMTKVRRNFEENEFEEIMIVEESFSQKQPSSSRAHSFNKESSLFSRLQNLESRIAVTQNMDHESSPTPDDVMKIFADSPTNSPSNSPPPIWKAQKPTSPTRPKLDDVTTGNKDGTRDSHPTGGNNIEKFSPLKRKKRTREEIEAEKELKEKERQGAKRAREELKNQKEGEKLRAKIEREISASLKSNCEKYMFCHLGRSLLENIPGLEVAAKMKFLDRNVEKQLLFDEREDMRVEWRRNCIEAVEDVKGGIIRFEYTMLQHFFLIVVLGDTLADLISSDCLMDWVQEQKAAFPVATSNMVVVCFGECKINRHKWTDANLDLFESYRAQLKKCKNIEELVQYLVQLTRSLARMEKRRVAIDGDKIVDVEKGIRDGPALMSDWWERMLDQVHKISHIQKRAVMRVIPNPLEGIAWIRRVGFEDASKELMNTMTENNRRLGPSLAYKICTILTNVQGDKLVE